MDDEYKVLLALFATLIFILISSFIASSYQNEQSIKCAVESQKVGKLNMLEIKELCK